MICQVRNSHPPLTGTLDTIPGDKSISHRAIILGALANNASRYSNFLFGEDCLNTAKIFQQLGVSIDIDHAAKSVEIQGVGLKGLSAPSDPLDVGNSGTSIRLLTGVLAGQSFESRLSGDASIAKRPMRRVVDPLAQMGARISGENRSGSDDIYPPLTVSPASELTGMTYELPVASAQVKSAVMLAGLYAATPTTVIEPRQSRDHTERMMAWYGADIRHNDRTISVSGRQPLTCPTQNTVAIPSDFSSAAFWIVLALLVPGSALTLTQVGLNPTRAALLDILIEMGANITVRPYSESIEPMGDITVRHSPLQNITIDPAVIPFIIDEIPILSVAGLFASGTMTVTRAKELRVKESDRIAGIVELIRQIGGTIEEHDDGFELTGGGDFQSFSIDPRLDHRMAMSAIVAAIAANVPAEIEHAECIATSFPNFFELMSACGQNVSVVEAQTS